MKSTKAVRFVLAALLIGALTLCFALADGTSISGRASGEVVFYVYTQSGSKLTFTQDKGTVISTGGMRNTIYGGYDITWYPTSQPYAAQTVQLPGRSADVQLNRGVAYTVRVTPWTLERLKTRDAYLGLPGKYERWSSPSEWSLSGSAGCLTGFAPYGAPAATPTPTPAPTAVPWYYYSQPATATPVPWYYYSQPATATPVPWYYYSQPATATPVPWYYVPAATATPVPWYYSQPAADATATVYVFYRQPDGKLITYSTEKLAPGSHTVTSKLNGSYFTPIGSTTRSVYVSASGVATPASITFYYQYNGGSMLNLFTPVPTAAPTPVPASAAVEILYKQTDGALLYRETRMLSEGTHMISYDNLFEAYPWITFLGPAAYNVTVYSNGTASASSLTFYFTVSAGYHPQPVLTTPTPTPAPLYDESATDQEALIGASKIYPRPKPGKGKNTFNYEAIGQKVTVHSKARSLQNDGSWWVCISANLRCWGQDYVIDHEWIKTTYLNPNSYDLDAVPMDPQYP